MASRGDHHCQPRSRLAVTGTLRLSRLRHALSTSAAELLNRIVRAACRHQSFPAEGISQVAW